MNMLLRMSVRTPLRRLCSFPAARSLSSSWLRAQPPLGSPIIQKLTVAPCRNFASAPPADEPKEQPDFYEVLGLQKGVSDDTLKSVYKKLAIDTHPDKFQGAEREAAEERFQAISEAYTVLSDDIMRKDYDSKLEAAAVEAARAAANKKVKAQSWNTEVPDLQVRRCIWPGRARVC